MKLPYRLGDSFALPVGDGTAVPAVITGCEHHVVTIEAGGIAMRVYDSALVLRRWRGGPAALRQAQGDTTICGDIFSPARAERVLAEFCGARRFDTDPVTVATSQTPGVILTNVGVRLNRTDSDGFTAAEGAGALTIAAPANRWTHVFPHVRRLTLDAPCTLDGLSAAFPLLRALRIGDGFKHVNASDFAGLESLVELDISHASITGLERLAELRCLQALRLAHIEGLRMLEPVAELPLRTLAIEHQPQLQSSAALRRITGIEQLELAGMWQWTIEECEWLFEMDSLKRVAVDIGGRRKNVELYGRARWAYPWPSFSDARLTSTVPLERSD